jgi:hypothetical protein
MGSDSIFPTIQEGHFVYLLETNEKNRPLDEFHNLMDREGWERVEQEIVVAR